MEQETDRYTLIPVHPTRLCDRCYYGCYLNSDKTWNCTAGCPDEDKDVCANNFKECGYLVFDGRDETESLKPYPDDYECDKQ